MICMVFFSIILYFTVSFYLRAPFERRNQGIFIEKNAENMKMNPAFERGPISQFAYISPLYKFAGLFIAAARRMSIFPIHMWPTPRLYFYGHLFIAASCMCGDLWCLDLQLMSTLLAFLVVCNFFLSIYRFLHEVRAQAIRVVWVHLVTYIQAFVVQLICVCCP